MSRPRSSKLWALAVAALAAALLVPITLATAQSFTPITTGILRLHMGSSDFFRYDPTFGGSSTQTLTTGTNGQTKCQVTVATTPALVTVGVDSDRSTPKLGNSGDSLGVKSGNDGTGTPCGRVNGGESITIQLGSALAGRTANYAELDIEGKQNVSILGQAFLTTASDPNAVVTSTTLTAAAFAGSDNGPDNDASNNRRLILGNLDPALSVEFDKIVLSVAPVGDPPTLQGAFSLEGGSDGSSLENVGPLGAQLGTRDSLVRIVAPSDGELNCGQTKTEAGVRVTRGQNLNASPACTPKPYSIDRTGDSVTFLVEGATQQATYTVEIDWTPVADTNPPVIAPTQIDIPGGFHDMQWCDPDGPDDLTNPDLPFLVGSTTEREIACITKQVWVYVSATQVQETETIYLEADVGFRK
ncbi:MAG TPA: hypothetical protein VFT27_02125 [Actinomycetota bacterium]|nr:hypothetical protein [Actinomycetota bacterium]